MALYDGDQLLLLTATVTHGQVTPSEQFFLELQKNPSDYYINFQTNIQMKNFFYKSCFYIKVSL